MTTRIMCQHKACVAIFAMAVLILAGTGVEAVTIVDSQGFESPDYSTTFLPPGGYAGQLEGQPVTPVTDTWQQATDSLLPDSVAVVQDIIKFSGDQAVRVDRAANSNDRWGVPRTGWPNLTYPQTILIDWDMRVDQTPDNCPMCSYGPFFGVEAYDYDPNGGTSWGLLGSLGVDATTGDVLFQDPGYFGGSLKETGTTVTLGNWNHFQIALDFAADEYSVYLDGTLLDSVGFVDGAFGLDDFTDADISALAAMGDPLSQSLIGRAYLDNFVVRQIPEPASILLILAGLAVAGIVRMRNNR